MCARLVEEDTTYNSHSSRQSTSLPDLSLIDVWNFSLPKAIVTKQLFVPCLPFVRRPLAAKTVNIEWISKLKRNTLKSFSIAVVCVRRVSTSLTDQYRIDGAAHAQVEYRWFDHSFIQSAPLQRGRFRAGARVQCGIRTMCNNRNDDGSLWVCFLELCESFQKCALCTMQAILSPALTQFISVAIYFNLPFAASHRLFGFNTSIENWALTYWAPTLASLSFEAIFIVFFFRW